MESNCYWFALHPDINRPIGGVKQIHRLAEAIVRSGRKAILIQDNADFHPDWFSSNVDTISKLSWLQLAELDPKYNSIVLPETFITSLPNYSLTLPKIIFNQNGSYTFGLESNRPSLVPRSVIDLYSSNHLSHAFCVSQHDYQLLSSGLGVPDSKLSLIVNGIETSLFTPGKHKKRQIAFMPRKNPRDCQIVLSMLSNKPWLKGWSLKPINNCSQDKVASIFQESMLFLSFGHPEGFGLPVAEALASGCAVIGYSGLGGRELFDLANNTDVAKEIPFGDWSGFIDATFNFIQLFDRKTSSLFTSMRSCSEVVRAKYNEVQMQQSVVEALNKFESRPL